MGTTLITAGVVGRPPAGSTGGLALSGLDSPYWEEREPHNLLCTPSSTEALWPLSGSADASGSQWGGPGGSWVPISASTWVWVPGTAQCGGSLRGRDGARLWGTRGCHCLRGRRRRAGGGQGGGRAEREGSTAGPDAGPARGSPQKGQMVRARCKQQGS